MGIPVLPLTPEKLVIKIQLISEKIKYLENEENEIKNNYPSIAENRELAYKKYRTSKSEDDLKIAYEAELALHNAMSRAGEIYKELQRLYILKSHLEKMVKQYGVKIPVESKKDEDEPVGGTLGG